MLLCKPDVPSSIAATHAKMEEETDSWGCPLTSTRMPYHTQHTHAHDNNLNIKNGNKLEKESPLVVYFAKSDGAGEMAQWAEVKLYDLRLIPEIHTVEGEH